MKILTLLACVLALIVIVLGAYTRLSDAGLGCPDWPGCYGQLTVPKDPGVIKTIEAQYQQPLVAEKAWTEMIHRYCAGTLGILVLLIAGLTLRKRQKIKSQHVLPLAIVILVIIQALLGMWTVTLKLEPYIILLHLFGGLSILSLLWWLFLTKATSKASPASELKLRCWIIGAIVVLLLQIALGGWTSANYAALVCPDFPFCQGRLLPAIDLSAFTLGQGLSKGNLELVSIHMSHRIGAMITGTYLGILSLWVFFRIKRPSIRVNALIILALLITQITLGVLNIVWLLPMTSAVGHNMIAALLLLSLLTLLKLTTIPERKVFQTYHSYTR